MSKSTTTQNEKIYKEIIALWLQGKREYDWLTWQACLYFRLALKA